MGRGRRGRKRATEDVPLPAPKKLARVPAAQSGHQYQWTKAFPTSGEDLHNELTPESFVDIAKDDTRPNKIELVASSRLHPKERELQCIWVKDPALSLESRSALGHLVADWVGAEKRLQPQLPPDSLGKFYINVCRKLGTTQLGPATLIAIRNAAIAFYSLDPKKVQYYLQDPVFERVTAVPAFEGIPSVPASEGASPGPASKTAPSAPTFTGIPSRLAFRGIPPSPSPSDIYHSSVAFYDPNSPLIQNTPIGLAIADISLTAEIPAIPLGIRWVEGGERTTDVDRRRCHFAYEAIPEGIQGQERLRHQKCIDGLRWLVYMYDGSCGSGKTIRAQMWKACKLLYT